MEFKDLIDGPVKVFTAEKDENVSSGQLRGAVIATAVGGIILGSIIARKRQSSGKDPILKVFF